MIHGLLLLAAAGISVSETELVTYPFSDPDPLKILLARELCRTRRFRECLDYLKDVTVLPSEHRDSATEYWHEAQKALGLPLTWPEGLGRGKPFEVSR